MILIAAAEWWTARNPRERALLILLATLIFALGSWYGIAAPVRSAAERAERHHVRAAELLREVESARVELGTGMPATDSPLADVLMLSAAEAGFDLETHREQSETEIAVSGHAAEPAVLFAWIEMLRRNHGLLVANLSVAREESAAALRVDALLVRGGA